MACKIYISNSAKSDLRLILDYISGELENPKAANDLMNKIEKCISQLKENPLMYTFIDDKKLANLGYRKAVVNNYIMIYRYNESTQVVQIMRFFYGSRNYFEYI